MTYPTDNTRPEVDEDGPETSVPNRLLARLVGADSCEHAADYVCHDCMTRAMDHGLSLLEGDHHAAENLGSAHPAPHPQGGTPLIWVNDDVGYRCPRCALFVCIPKQDGATCPDCHTEKETT